MLDSPGNGSTMPEGGPEAAAGGADQAKRLKALAKRDSDAQYHKDRERRIKRAVRLELSGKDPDSPFAFLTHPRKRAYLRAYSETGRKGLAAALARVSPYTPNTAQWKDDPLFQEGLRIAEVMACLILEDEITRRGVEGVVKPTGWYKGEPGGFVREYSDTLLIVGAKARMPDKYLERREIRGTFGHIDLNRVAQMPNGQELLARLAAGESPFSVLGEPARPALPTGKPEVGTLRPAD